MADTTPSTPAPRLAAGFDGFLRAEIRYDSGGEPLSVVSALARLDVDPWAEAATLALMPAEAAARRLTTLLAKLPAASLGPGVLSAAAPGLIALLPKPASAARSRLRDGAHSRFLRVVALLSVILLAAVATGVLFGPPPASTADATAMAPTVSTRPPAAGLAPSPTRAVGP